MNNKALLATLLIALSFNAYADRFIINLGSYHINADQELNEFNPGLGYEWLLNENTLKYIAGIGGYKNSYNDLSAYGTIGIERGNFGAFAGLASGYEHTASGILPIAAGYFQQSIYEHISFRVLAAPGPGIIGIDKSSDAVVAVQLFIR